MTDFNEIDVDGAIMEQAAGADALSPGTRAAFIKKAGIAGGAVLSSSAIMGMLPSIASAAPSKKQDLKILNFALTLEYLEAAFYKEAVAGNKLSGPTSDLATLVASHEATHVSALRRTIKSLGGKPVASPKFNFRGTTQDQPTFVLTSFTLENTGVRAYLGQAGRLQSKALLGAAASIVTVEARHAAAWAAIINQNPYKTGNKSVTPSGAFDRSSSMSQILSALAKTKFIVG